MKNQREVLKRYPALLSAVVLALLLAAITLADGSIDATNKWAWGTNAGWVSLNDANGSTTVFSDHLEGYAWGENVGWMRLGTASGGSAHTYANDAANTYGVNNDGCGNLSGYAWGTNIGWINFNPNDSQVTIDPTTGDFDGYAWSENVGWIKFKGTAVDTTDYKTNTNWRATLDSVVPSISLMAPTVDLNWSAVSGATSTNIYRAQNDPYFTPGSVHANTSDLFYSESAAGNPANNYTYIVRAVGCGGAVESADSQRLGEFDFAIVAGS